MRLVVGLVVGLVVLCVSGSEVGDGVGTVHSPSWSSSQQKQEHKDIKSHTKQH